MKKLLLISGLLLCAVTPGRAVVPSRDYYEQANEAKFEDVHLRMTIAEVHKICGGRWFGPFETIREGFAFAVDEKRSGILSLPWHIDLTQTVDFFTSPKRVLVVFDKEGKVDGIMVFDFAKGQWENRSRPATTTKTEPNSERSDSPPRESGRGLNKPGE